MIRAGPCPERMQPQRGRTNGPGEVVCLGCPAMPISQSSCLLKDQSCYRWCRRAEGSASLPGPGSCWFRRPSAESDRLVWDTPPCQWAEWEGIKPQNKNQTDQPRGGFLHQNVALPLKQPSCCYKKGISGSQKHSPWPWEVRIQFLFLRHPGPLTQLLSCATHQLSNTAASRRSVAGINKSGR